MPRCVIAVFYAAANAFNMTKCRLVKTHQLYRYGRPNMNPAYLRFFKVSGDPEAGGIDDGNFCYTCRRIIAWAEL